jgi:hypothetical protein
VEFRGKQVNPAAYDVLWDKAVPELAKPAVLYGDSPGDTPDERGRIERAALEHLQRAGYLGPLGVFEEAADVLNIVGRPQLAVDVRHYEWLPGDQGQWVLAKAGIRVAVHSWRGAVAVLTAGYFQAWSFPATSLIDEVIRLFVPYDAQVRFDGVAVYTDQLAPNQRPARRNGVEATLRLMEGPYLRRAYLNALGRDGTSEGLVLNDVHTGRFLVFPDRNQVAIAPGDRRTFERKLKDLIEPFRRF